MGLCISSVEPTEAKMCGEWVRGGEADLSRLRGLLLDKEQCLSSSTSWEMGDITNGVILQIQPNGRVYFITANGNGKFFHYIGPAKDWNDGVVKGCCGGICFTKEFGSIQKSAEGEDILLFGGETLVRNSNPGIYTSLPAMP